MADNYNYFPFYFPKSAQIYLILFKLPLISIRIKMSDCQYEVEAIIGKRYDHYQKNPEYLVKWKNYPVEQSTWEPVRNVKNAKKFIEIYQLENSRKKISVVEVKNIQKRDFSLNQSSKQQKQQRYCQQISSQLEDKQIEQVQRRYQKNKLINNKRREQTALFRLTNGKKPIFTKKLEKTEKKADGSTLILKMSQKNSKVFFKVWENKKIIWRNRHYMLEFHPNELCDFYENFLLQKYLGG